MKFVSGPSYWNMKYMNVAGSYSLKYCSLENCTRESVCKIGSIIIKLHQDTVSIRRFLHDISVQLKNLQLNGNKICVIADGVDLNTVRHGFLIMIYSYIFHHYFSSDFFFLLGGFTPPFSLYRKPFQFNTKLRYSLFIKFCVNRISRFREKYIWRQAVIP